MPGTTVDRVDSMDEGLQAVLPLARLDRPDHDRTVVAFGPAVPWGSWQWVGEETVRELPRYFVATRYALGEVPEADVIVVVKHLPPPSFFDRIPPRSAILYCPVDYYGDASQIDQDGALLRRCCRIVVHCERLRKYFSPYAPVVYMDHPVRFITTDLVEYRTEGYVLWVGVWSNLPPLVQWVNAHPLPCQLKVLTNLDDLQAYQTPADLGFCDVGAVSVEQWSEERHRELTLRAMAALDIKGDDFRARHKPPAKGIDFITSGLPLAMNPQSSTAEHLARMGFEVVSPSDANRWFSREYWEETRSFGQALRELLSRRRIGLRYKRLIEEVLAERRAAGGLLR